MSYMVSHNGHNVDFFSSELEAKEHIRARVEKERAEHNIRLELIAEFENEGSGCYVYQWATLYHEVFVYLKR